MGEQRGIHSVVADPRSRHCCGVSVFPTGRYKDEKDDLRNCHFYSQGIFDDMVT